jgi:hypothetical protein
LASNAGPKPWERKASANLLLLQSRRLLFHFRQLAAHGFELLGRESKGCVEGAQAGASGGGGTFFHFFHFSFFFFVIN